MSEATKATRVCDLPPLSESDVEVSQFHVRDNLWAAIVELFDQYREESSCSYATLGRRINRSRKQVQRWLSAPRNITIASAGLLAEGLDAELYVQVVPRKHREWWTNEVHPCDEARAFVGSFAARSKADVKPLANRTNQNLTLNAQSATSPAPSRAFVTFDIND